jgi:hypothetical protein
LHGRREISVDQSWEGIEGLVWVTAFMIGKFINYHIHTLFRVGGISAYGMYGKGVATFTVKVKAAIQTRSTKV